MKSKLLIVFLFLSITLGYAQFESASFMVNGYTLRYKVMFPENYDEAKKYPLVVFLHGAGERGDDNEKQLIHGKDFLINNFQSKYPAIVIAPQCPADDYWSNVMSHTIGTKREFNFAFSETPTAAMRTLVYLVNEWLSSGKIDLKQVYAGGLSMGGMGTYELTWRMPATFAAAFPICGGGSIEKVTHYSKTTAFWLFHGSDDNVVPPTLSRDMEKALKVNKTEVKYTEYMGVNHGSWVNAFQEEGLAKWLFGHKK